MVYIFRSKAGTFTIEYDEIEKEAYCLCIGGMCLAVYETAERAAHDVCMKKTGWVEWDADEDAEGPRDISEWETE